LRIVLEHTQHVDEVRAIHRITANTDTRRLPNKELR
jgi:hypothetical protein